MGIDNTIFQELESFEEREVFQNGYGSVLDFFCKILKYSKIDLTYCCIKTLYMLCLFIVPFIIET